MKHIERNRLPDERASITRKFKIGDLRVYVNVGLYSNGQPGEVFIRADKVGTLTSGVLDALAIVISIALQHGVELSVITNKLTNMRFEPSGRTTDAGYPVVNSILDYISRWLSDKFCAPTETESETGPT